jgi:Asp-tRNAAsn/Glu-tRNAGln amidotransferase A subunit and related amidases
VSAVEYIRLLARHRANVRSAAERMATLDAWVAPTCPVLPIAVGECKTVETAVAWNKRSLRNTQPVNYLGQCAVSLPLAVGPRALPVGLQIVCAANEDTRLLSIAMAAESLLGTGSRPSFPEIEPAAHEPHRGGRTVIPSRHRSESCTIGGFGDDRDLLDFVELSARRSALAFAYDPRVVTLLTRRSRASAVA